MELRLISPSMSSNRDHWQAEARQVARRVNLAWCLETLSAPLLVSAVIGAVVLLVIRREQPDLELGILIAAVVGGIFLMVMICSVRARKRFENSEQSLVRIEATMRLRNALSAAHAGVAPWPAPIAKTNAGLQWQWPRLLVPPLGALVLLAAGLLIPMPVKGTNGPGAQEQPQAWKQLHSELDQLTKEEVIDEKYLEETRKKLQELESQAEEQWFSHSSLEATDSLKKSHRAETDRVERELGRAEKALSNLEKNAGSASPEEKNRLMDEFDQALQGLQNGAMKPNPALLEQMKQLDLKQMANLTPDQMAQLRENLEKNAQAMKNSKPGGEEEDWSDELLGDENQGECDGKEGKDGKNGPGKGGVNRGPGHDPNLLGKETDALETGELTGLQAKDLSNSTPGDLLELQDGEHDVNTNSSQSAAGGETQATGKGGDRVWKDALDPDEQRTLKRFFE
jgi:hypothetical protein